MSEKARETWRRKMLEQTERPSAACLATHDDEHDNAQVASSQASKSTLSTVSVVNTSPYLPVKPQQNADLASSQPLPHKNASPPVQEPTARREPLTLPAKVSSKLDGASADPAVGNSRLIKHEKRPNSFIQDMDASLQKADHLNHSQGPRGSTSSKKTRRDARSKVGADSVTILGHVTLGEVLDIPGGDLMSKQARAKARRAAYTRAKNERRADADQEEALFSYLKDSVTSEETISERTEGMVKTPFKGFVVKKKDDESHEIERGALQDEIRDLQYQLSIERQRNSVLDGLVRLMTGLDRDDTLMEL